MSLIALLAIAWRFAVTLTAVPRPITPPVGKPDEEVWVTQGQLVTEVPERNEVWTLQFHRGRYDPKAQTALTEKSVCQVRRKGRIVTLFSAPHIFVRFKERVMVMEGGCYCRRQISAAQGAIAPPDLGLGQWAFEGFGTHPLRW